MLPPMCICEFSKHARVPFGPQGYLEGFRVEGLGRRFRNYMEKIGVLMKSYTGRFVSHNERSRASSSISSMVFKKFLCLLRRLLSFFLAFLCSCQVTGKLVGCLRVLSRSEPSPTARQL